MKKKKISHLENLQDRGLATKKKLIEAGLTIYSEMGFAGASTRRLAAAAGVNIAAIPYYFGSKEGLYLAVTDHIVDYYQRHLGNDLTRIRKALETPETADCDDLLDRFMRLLVRFILQKSDERFRISRIYVREQLDPTSAFNRIYEGFIKDMRRTLEILVATILGGDPESREIKLLAETLLGQVAIFNFSRVTVLHNMGWNNYDDDKTAEIERIVSFNVGALMRAYRQKDAGV